MKKIFLKKLNFDELTRILKSGGLVVFPSDTVYGLLVDATNEKAVKKLIAFKERPVGKAISVFVLDFLMMKKYVDLNEEKEKLLSQILPGPFTIILNSKHKICSELESEKGTLGVRIPLNQSINQLIEFYGKPVTATSANLAGQAPHYSIESLLKTLSKKKMEMIDLIVDAGKLPVNKPSTVVDLTESTVKILRQGDLNFNKSQKIISNSSEETKKIAQDIFKKIKKDKRPLFFVIEGELGVGKTIFVKGLGELFGIKNIISPTYVVYYEYDIKSFGFAQDDFVEFIHADLYNIQEEKEFDYLGLEKYFEEKNLICFEWGERMGKMYERLKTKGTVVYVKMKYLIENKRSIEISC